MASSGRFASFFAASSFHVAIAESTSPAATCASALPSAAIRPQQAVGARALHDLVELRDGVLLLSERCKRRRQVVTRLDAGLRLGIRVSRGLQLRQARRSASAPRSRRCPFAPMPAAAGASPGFDVAVTGTTAVFSTTIACASRSCPCPCWRFAIRLEGENARDNHDAGDDQGHQLTAVLVCVLAGRGNHLRDFVFFQLSTMLGFHINLLFTTETCPGLAQPKLLPIISTGPPSRARRPATEACPAEALPTISSDRGLPSRSSLQMPRERRLASPDGFEPSASRLGGARSIQLSYGDSNR